MYYKYVCHKYVAILINRVKLGRMFHAQNLKAFIKARMSFRLLLLDVNQVGRFMPGT